MFKLNFETIVLILIGIIVISDASPHHRDSSEESFYYGPRRVKYKNYYYNHPPPASGGGAAASAHASAFASAGSSGGSNGGFGGGEPGLVEQPIPPAAGGYYGASQTVVLRDRQPLLPTMSPEEIAEVHAQSNGRPQPLLPTTHRPDPIFESTNRVPPRETVHPRPLLPTQRPAYAEGASASHSQVVVSERQQYRPSNTASVAQASASASASAGSGTASNGGGAGNYVISSNRPNYHGSYDLNNVNEGVSTILDGVGKGSLAEILRGSFAFTGPNSNVRNIAYNVIDSIFGKRGTDTRLWPALNNNGKK